MPIRYYINPELNIVLYIAEGVVTGTEYFKAAETASNDKLRRWGMVTIIDILFAEADFDLKDLQFVIEFSNKVSQKGLEPEQVIALTQSQGIRLIANTLQLMSGQAPINFNVFSNLDEIISFLGYADRRQEFTLFYNRCKLER